jgi:hypothetical protein
MSAPTTFSTGTRLDFAHFGSSIVVKNGIMQLRRGVVTGRNVNRIYPTVEAWVDSFKSTAAAAGAKVTQRPEKNKIPLMKQTLTVPTGANDAEIAFKFQTMYGSWTGVRKYASIKQQLAAAKIDRLQLELDGKQHSAEEIALLDEKVKCKQYIYDATPSASRGEAQYIVNCVQPRVFVQMGNGTMQPFAVHKDCGMIIVGRNTIGRATFAELGVPFTGGTLKTSTGEVVRSIPEFWILRGHMLTRIDSITMVDPAPPAAPPAAANADEMSWEALWTKRQESFWIPPAGAAKKTQEELAAQYAGQVIDKYGCLPCGKQVRYTRWDGSFHYLDDWQAV